MRRRILLTCLIFGIPLLLLPGLIRFWKLKAYQIQFKSTRQLLDTIERSRPPDVDQKTWDAATGWAFTAYCNVCFSETHVPLTECRELHGDLKERMEQGIDLRTIDWFWARMKRASPHGQRYITKWEPAFRHEVYGEPQSEP